MPGARPIRFGMGPRLPPDRDALVESALLAERAGFSTYAVGDHFWVPLSPLIALQAVADATTKLRLTMTVLDQDFRHPAMLAKDLATLDVLSGGRVEVGIGAGWNRLDYQQTGIRFDRASVRIERLEEVVIILKGLFSGERFSYSGKHFTITDMVGLPRPSQRPRPPIMVAGGGRKLVSAAARQADIVAIALRNTDESMDTRELTMRHLEEKVNWIRDAAGDRFEDVELNSMLFSVAITGDRQTARQRAAKSLRAIAAGSRVSIPSFSEDEILDSPHFAIGTADDVCEKLLGIRDRLGINYFTVFGSGRQAIPELLEKLAGD